MSISRFQERFLGPGCLTALGIGMALVLVGGSFYSCGQGQRLQDAGAGQGSGEKIAEIGGAPIFFDEIRNGVEQQKAQYAQFGGMPPEQEAVAYGQAIKAALDGAAVQAITKKAGFRLTDEQIRAAADAQWAQAVTGVKLQLQFQKKISSNATDAEVDKAVKAQYGKTLAELKKQSDEGLTKALSQNRAGVEAKFVRDAYVASLAAQNPPSDDALKASYRRLTVRRILTTGPTADADAQKALAAVKSGTAFPTAMDRYSKEPPPPGKKLSATTFEVSGRQTADEPYRVLANARPGTVTDPVETPEGTVIYQVVSEKTDLPKDFDKKKEDYRKDLARQGAEARLREQVEAMLKDPKSVAWSPGPYQLAYRLGTATPGSSDFRAIADEAKGIKGGDPRLGALIRYAALENLARQPGARADALAAERAEAIAAVLQTSEEPTLRLTLVDLYRAQKDPKAGEALLEAAKYNSDTTTAGQGRYAQIQSLLTQLQEAKLVTPEVAKEINEEQARWRRDKIEADKAQREADVAAKAAPTAPATPPAPGKK